MYLTEKFAKLVAGTRYTDIPPEAIDKAKECILDCLGVAVAGSAEPINAPVRQYIEAVGGQVVGISYDPVEKLKGYAKRSQITFPLLSDAGSKTIDAYDIRYKEAAPEVSGFARHATFILDQKGVIRAKLFQLSYQERPAVDALINALKEARKPTGETKS